MNGDVGIRSSSRKVCNRGPTIAHCGIRSQVIFHGAPDAHTGSVCAIDRRGKGPYASITRPSRTTNFRRLVDNQRSLDPHRAYCAFCQIDNALQVQFIAYHHSPGHVDLIGVKLPQQNGRRRHVQGLRIQPVHVSSVHVYKFRASLSPHRHQRDALRTEHKGLVVPIGQLQTCATASPRKVYRPSIDS